MSLPKLRTGLRFNRLDNQVLVYDARVDAVHLLDPTTTLLTDLLRKAADEREIETELGRRGYGESSEHLIGLAFNELRQADLLDEGSSPTPRLTEVTRRELLRKVTLTGAAALLVPAIATLTASPAYAATLLPNCAPCTDKEQCTSHQCKANGETRCGPSDLVCP